MNYDEADDIEIPVRVELLIGYSRRDFQELQHLKRQGATPSEIQAARHRLSMTNRRLVNVAENIKLPERLYAPGL
jgi:ABC-type Fe2+-enterobactin transport system substrate-binding protein